MESTPEDDEFLDVIEAASAQRNHEEAATGPEGTEVKPVPWQLWSSDSEGTRLTVHYFTNRGYEFDRVDQAETERTVTITVFERPPVGTLRLAGVVRRASLILDKPVGDRAVVDGATGEERPRRGT